MGGSGWCFIIIRFLQVCKFAEKLRNACGKTCGMLQVLDFQEFYAFYSAYSAYAEMYRKMGILACKNRAKGRSGGLGVVFRICGIGGKKSIKCLIFNGLGF